MCATMQHRFKSFPKNKLFYVFENSAVIYFEIEDLKKEQDPFLIESETYCKCTGKLQEIKQQREKQLMANLWAQISDAT